MISRRYILKQLGEEENTAYTILERYRAELVDGQPSLVVPKVLEQMPGINLVKLSKLPGFKPMDIRQHFGDDSHYSSQDYELILSAFQKLRSTIPMVETSFASDYDLNLEGQLHFIANQVNHPRVQNAPFLMQLGNLEEKIVKSQGVVDQLKSFVAHRDANVSNITIHETQLRGKQVQMIDWQTIGPAKIGYDEARFALTLSLNPSQQELLTNTFFSNINDSNIELYFWRTLAIRAFRGLCAVQTGFYDYGIFKAFNTDQDRLQFRERLIISIYSSLTKSLNNI